MITAQSIHHPGLNLPRIQMPAPPVAPALSTQVKPQNATSQISSIDKVKNQLLDYSSKIQDSLFRLSPFQQNKNPHKVNQISSYSLPFVAASLPGLGNVDLSAFTSDPTVQEIISHLPAAGMFLGIGAFFWAGGRVLEKVIHKYLINADIHEKTKLSIQNLIKVGRFGLTSLGVLLAIAITMPSYSKYLIPILAVIGSGIGFGIRQVFANGIAGLILYFSNPFHLGDHLIIKDSTDTYEGIVVSRGLLDTRIIEVISENKQLDYDNISDKELWDQTDITTIPNSLFQAGAWRARPNKSVNDSVLTRLMKLYLNNSLDDQPIAPQDEDIDINPQGSKKIDKDDGDNNGGNIPPQKIEIHDQ